MDTLTLWVTENIWWVAAGLTALLFGWYQTLGPKSLEEKQRFAAFGYGLTAAIASLVTMYVIIRRLLVFFAQGLDDGGAVPDAPVWVFVMLVLFSIVLHIAPIYLSYRVYKAVRNYTLQNSNDPSTFAGSVLGTVVGAGASAALLFIVGAVVLGLLFAAAAAIVITSMAAIFAVGGLASLALGAGRR